MSRFQGRSAEKAFSKLCSDSGVTCNESVEDEHGWDHLLEFPMTIQPGVSADMQSPIPAVFVQTKSHSGKSLRVTMKLSNAVRLAQMPAPAFVILHRAEAEIAKGQHSWFAVHFWEPLMQRALRRAREASRDGIEDTLNRQTFSFSMTESDRREGNELLPWIIATVKGTGPDYATAKKALIPPPEIVGTVSFGVLDSLEQLVDHSLGLTPEITISSLTLDWRRFGISLPFPLPIPNGTPIQFSMQPNPSDHCDVWLRGPDGSIVEVVGDILVPGIPNLPRSEQKIRIRTPIFDLIWRIEGEVTIKANFNSAVRRLPAELEKLVRFISWGGHGEIDIHVTLRDEPLVLGMASLDAIEHQATFAMLAQEIGMLVRLSAHLKTKIPQISVTDLYESEEVLDLYRFVHGTDMRIKFITPDGQETPEINEAVASGAAQIGDWVFVAIQHLPITKQERDGNEIALEFGAPVLLRSHAFLAKDTKAIEQVEADFQRYINKKGILGMSNILSKFRPNDVPAK